MRREIFVGVFSPVCLASAFWVLIDPESQAEKNVMTDTVLKQQIPARKSLNGQAASNRTPTILVVLGREIARR